MKKTPLQRLKAFIEKGARNNTNDAAMIQSMHDNSVSLGADCSVKEAAGFSQTDLMSVLTNELREDIAPNAYILDIFDDSLVYCKNYYYQAGSYCYQVKYSVTDNGEVTWGTSIEVVRKVTYVATNVDDPPMPTMESGDVELTSDSVALVETETPLIEANTRMLKLIAPGWGSSGYYSADVLKRDAHVFKAGTHNYIDHLTEQEKKHKPEGFVERLASVLKEDAHWEDDYKGNGAGLYALADVRTGFNDVLSDIGQHIGTSINANGKVKIGEVENRKGPIIEAITSCRSIDYVTVAGAGGKVLDLVESAKQGIKVDLQGNGKSFIDKTNIVEPIVENVNVKETNDMSDQQTTLQETMNRLNAKITKSEATQYARTKIDVLRVKSAVKDRIITECIKSIPLDADGDIDFVKFDALIETSVKSETDYLSNVGALGKISGFGGTPPVAPNDTPVKSFAEFQESLNELN